MTNLPSPRPDELENELWNVFEYNFGRDRCEQRDIETMSEVLSLIRAYVAKEAQKARIEELVLMGKYMHLNFHQTDDLMKRIDALAAGKGQKRES